MSLFQMQDTLSVFHLFTRILHFVTVLQQFTEIKHALQLRPPLCRTVFHRRHARVFLKNLRKIREIRVPHLRRNEAHRDVRVTQQRLCRTHLLRHNVII